MQYDSTINQWHTCPASGRINASNPCVTGDTRVLTPGGIWRRIDQMIHLPARIVTNVDGKQIHVVEGAFPTGTKEVFELKTLAGFAVKCTADHKIWTRSRGWVEAQHLTMNDEVRLMSEPACVEEVGEPVEAKLFQMAGFLLSDANNSLTSLKLEDVLADNEQVDAFSTYANEVWGNAEALGEIGGSVITRTLTNRRLLSRIGAFVKVERDALTGKNVRRLSDDAFTSGCAAQKHLLRGLFTADGVVEQGSVVLRHASAALLQDVQLILMSFGIFSRRDDAMLRIDEANLRAYGKHIAFLPGAKLEQLAQAIGANEEVGGRFALLPQGRKPRQRRKPDKPGPPTSLRPHRTRDEFLRRQRHHRSQLL